MRIQDPGLIIASSFARVLCWISLKQTISLINTLFPKGGTDAGAALHKKRRNPKYQ